MGSKGEELERDSNRKGKKKTGEGHRKRANVSGIFFPWYEYCFKTELR